MEDSILNSTKKILGIIDDYTPFDFDIINYINSAFAIVTQIGVGPIDGFSIEDDQTNWSDFPLPTTQMSMVRTFIFLKVRILFDPPTTSFLIEATNKQIDEYLYRLSYLREDLIPLPVSVVEEVYNEWN